MISEKPHGVDRAKADLPESQSAWQRISQELHLTEKLKGDSADMRIARAAYITGQGLYEGSTRRIADIVEHPTEALKGVAIGAASIGLMIATRGRYGTRLLPTAFAASAAINVIPHLDDVSSAYKSAWASNENLHRDGSKLSCLGVMAVDYGIARLTLSGAKRGLGAWAESVGNGVYTAKPGQPGWFRSGLNESSRLPSDMSAAQATGRSGAASPMRAKEPVDSLSSLGKPLTGSEGGAAPKGPQKLHTHEEVMMAADRARQRLEAIRGTGSVGARIEQAQVPGVPKSTSDAAGVPQARPRELPQPINLMKKPFASPYARPEDDWPAIHPV
ncbi:MAG: hypothetical protein SFV17_08965 [Candidatus Obscuribacter sp.]|nr:hypothetical protein [Candidatus Obscuribacter sp.]